jgi:TPR repeat protein
VLKDNAKAARWYRKAAQQGLAKGQFILGLMYATDQGVLKDNVQAYAWLNIAATQGHEKGKNSRDMLKGTMTPNQIAEAQKLSSELWDKYVVPFQKD